MGTGFELEFICFPVRGHLRREKPALPLVDDTVRTEQQLLPVKRGFPAKAECIIRVRLELKLTGMYFKPVPVRVGEFQDKLPICLWILDRDERKKLQTGVLIEPQN